MTAQRNYLTEERDLTFDFESDIPQNAKISEIFCEITRRLEVKFNICKGVLVVRNQNENAFLAISTWNKGEFLDGLAISLPTTPSLFEQIAMDGNVYSDTYGGIFSGNFFEKKLLLNDNSKSYVLHPLKHEGEITGMIGYSSEEEMAFSLFEEGVLQDVTSRFAKIISERSGNSNY